MISKTWQIWSIFLLCLTLAALAMVWMSVRTAEAERNREFDRQETELARREAELLERVSSALYRMDWMLSPIVTQEAARSHLDYRVYHRTHFVESPDANRGSVNSFHLMTTGLSDFVKLHFEIRANGKIESPQAPTDDQISSTGMRIEEPSLSRGRELAAIAGTTFEFQQLLALCPVDKLPDVFSPNYPSDQALAGQPGQRPVYDVTEAPMNNESVSNADSTVQTNQTGNQILIQQQSRGQGRGNDEYRLRQESLQNSGLNKLANNASMGRPGHAPEFAEGVMKPVWINDRLLLVRRVVSDQETFVQCCWLDWEKIKASLQDRVKDLLSDVEFERIESIADLKPQTALATLPVQLVVDKQLLLSTLALENTTDSSRGETGLWPPLLLAWLGFGLAAIASAVLLSGVIKLSERRAAFVSAVTHELRTPLTTFRMYAEMLAGDMVPEEKRQKYAQTLKVQADRLSHLVENVLQFARLERGPGDDSRETLRVDELLERIGGRLEERATEANMELSLEFDSGVGERSIHTLSPMVELVLFNLVDNACKYARSAEDRRIMIQGCGQSGRLLISVRDFGPGVSERDRQRMFRPFCKAEVDDALESGAKPPGVGLGLSLCRRIAGSLGGKLEYAPHDNGSEFVFALPLESA